MYGPGAFLQSEEWERFQQAAGAEARRGGDGTLWIGRRAPLGIRYWSASRTAGIPADPGFGGAFLHVEPIRGELPGRPAAAAQPRATVLLDLTLPEEALLAGMKPKHRYNLKLARKHAVSVSRGGTGSADRFLDLLSATTGRHGFRAHPDAYYRTLLDTVPGAYLLFASLGERDLAAGLFLDYAGCTTYLHGGSADAGKEHMAPYLLHWQALTTAKEAGMDTYDFWGADPVPSPGGGWKEREGTASAGTTRFKLGFGGTVERYPGAADLVLQPLPYAVYASGRKLLSRRRAFS